MYYFGNVYSSVVLNRGTLQNFFLQESPRDVSEFADVVGEGGGIFSVNLKRKKN